MDINSLLSPSESPRSTPNSSGPPPSKRPRKASALSPGSSVGKSTKGTPPIDGARSGRQGSTPGMDALADLASMQHHQQTARVNAGGWRNTDIYDNQASTATNLPSIPPLPTTQDSSILRTPSFDRAMTDTNTQTPSPRQLTASSLPETDQRKVTELAKHVSSNPFAYESHVQLINILHQGLLNHVRLQTTSHKSGNPQTYGLLKELQDAREAMSTRFALGEDLLADWIQDQILLAHTLEMCVSVMELCERAVEEERLSTKLWLIYAQWMLSLYRNANTNDAGVAGWSEEERMMAREVFSWQQVLAVWQRGALATNTRINDSQLLWEPYSDLLLQDLGSSPQPEQVSRMHSHFQFRLQYPHATWDQTFQSYSTFVSRYDDRNYESVMADMNHAARPAKRVYEARDLKELGLLRASQQNDRVAELQCFYEYLEFEKTVRKQKHQVDFELLDTLYQRSTLRFPANTELWEAYVMFLNDEISNHAIRKDNRLSVLEQAIRHCPWSGSLWGQYLLAAEVAKLSFAEIGELKHRATSSGLLDAGAMEEVLKVHSAWCSFLRRRAFAEGATDEERDVAEVGIRSAIEDMDTAGRSKYGNTYQGDPEFRLEKIYIQYFTQCRNWDAVRETYRKLVSSKGDAYDFWLRWYWWEMMVWSQSALGEKYANGGKFVKPTDATKVLQQAIKRQSLDWPEKIIESYRSHCEDYEDAEQVQQALAQIWKATRAVQSRREKEAYEAQQAQMIQDQQQLQQQVAHGQNGIDSHEEINFVGKRKREDEEAEGAPVKRPREEEEGAVSPGHTENDITTENLALRRDREHSTLVVKNLAATTTEVKIRQFFRDCGTINSIQLLPEQHRGTATAIVEFESKDDCTTAMTRDRKTLDGNVVELQIGTESTLYVCNFPPAADETWIREKFQEFGEIVDIRFPSLKFNTHRRFCYVQFKSPTQALAATQLDGEEQGDGLKLLAKLSDPAQKQDRHGAMAEGREVFLANVDWGASEKDLKQAFSKYGKVESARVLKKLNGQSKGVAFVVFRDKDAANAALEMNLTRFHGRALNVSLSTNDMAKRQTSHIIISASNSQRGSNSPAPDAQSNGIRPRIGSPDAKDAGASNQSAEIQSRTLALMNVPDTVNDSRIRALAQEYGDLVKVVLRPDHQGAIIEYRDLASVGKAAMGLEGREISAGRTIVVGTVGQMMKTKAEKKNDKAVFPPQSNFIRRPFQSGPRRGRKGGLGTKGAGVGLSGPRAKDGGGTINTGRSDGTAPKSNTDFRDMFLKN